MISSLEDVCSGGDTCLGDAKASQSARATAGLSRAARRCQGIAISARHHRLEPGGALPVTLSLVNELDSVSSNGTPAWDSARYLREILKAPVYEAAEHTPLQEMPALSARLGNTVEVKREDLQTVHSFKIRGAYNAMRSLSPAERERGVVTASAGNHAQGVARSAALLGMSAIIVMPTVTPQIKVDAVRALGGEVRLHGDNFDAAKAEATRLAEVEGHSYIAPFDDPRVIAGQGTIGLELIQQDAHLDRVFVPVGGGGLAAAH